jgi:hypothetical protein
MILRFTERSVEQLLALKTKGCDISTKPVDVVIKMTFRTLLHHVGLVDRQ